MTEKRPTIPDLAAAAGVSVSTVNRVINASGSVKQPTQERVLRAARDIGFYGLGNIEHTVVGGRETHRLGILLQQGGRAFYRNLGEGLRLAAQEFPGANIDLELDFLDDLSPDNVASHLRALGARCDAVALVAAEHPKVSEAIEEMLRGSVPVIGLISPLSARGNVGFVGVDNRKVGRTAAWAFDRMCREPGEIGILVGNHRYRNQEINESGFRSYFREHNADFTLLEPLSTYESAAVAREMTERLLADHPGLCGLFISGGGITGAIAALRDRPRRPGFVAVGYELFDVTREALIDGTLTMVLSHPIERLSREALSAMVRARRSGPDAGAQRVLLDFDMHVSENV